MKGVYILFNDVLTAIAQVGFPIAVATYSLVVLNKTISENTKVMQELSAKFETLFNRLEKNE